MKSIFKFFITIQTIHELAYCAKVKDNSIRIESYIHENEDILTPGIKKTMNCKASHRSQKLEWVDPSGKVVNRMNSRVYAHEQFIQSSRQQNPMLVLTFDKLLSSDSGEWECRSGNQKEKISICVMDKLTFLDTPTEVIVDKGRAITLSCQADGDPESMITWRRNREVIDDDSSSKYKLGSKYKVNGFESLLTISSLESDDAGVYTCEAMQEITDDCVYVDELNITLRVNRSPSFDDDELELVYGNSEESVNLTCGTDGYPSPIYTWYKDLGDSLVEIPKQQLIYVEDDNQTQVVLTLRAGPTTFGQRYKCRASNVFGEAEKSFVLLELEEARAPDEIKVYNSTDSKIQFKLVWKDDANFPIDGFTIQYIKLEDLKVSVPREVDWFNADIEIAIQDDTEEEVPGQFITLSDLEADTEYWFRVQAENAAGNSPWSVPIRASTTAEEETPATVINATSPPFIDTTYENFSDGVLYAIVIGVGVVIFAAIFLCMTQLHKPK